MDTVKFRSIDPRFVLDPFQPAYAALSSDEIRERVAAGLDELADCCACPRNCHVNRLENETKICHTGRFARVAKRLPHFGEEDCLRGWRGSGTIFFSLCNLRCVFCQNWDISQQSLGAELPPQRLAETMLGLQARGCHNINFVTPEHVAPQVLEAIAAAIPRGLRVPMVYNTSGYDSVKSLQLLDGIVDIYMPDFKFWKRETRQAPRQSAGLSRARSRGDSGNATPGRRAQVRAQRAGATRRAGAASGDARTSDEAAAIFPMAGREVSPIPTSISWVSIGLNTKSAALPGTEHQNTPRSTAVRSPRN